MKGHDLLIKNGMVIDPSQGLHEVMDVLISEGRIAGIGKGLDAGTAEVLDAAGMLVMPGFIDLHAHLREPGDEEVETIQSGCEAAARGGFTAVCAMPNTDPPADDAGRIRYIIERAASAPARVYPVGAITRGRTGKEIVEMADMARAGAVGFSDDGCSIEDARIMLSALRYAAMLGRPIIGHEEDASLDDGGQMNESALSTELGLKGMPAIAEETMVLRDLAIAEYTNTPLHITHVSTQGTVAIIREAKERGVKVTCDVTPHHLVLTEDAVAAYDTRFKMNPPLRTREDLEALRRGLADGAIDAIATDHAPHYIEQKECEFIYAAFGVTGLETALGVIHRELVEPGILTWDDVVTKLSDAPARILGVEGGTLTVGALGDVTIYNPQAPWTVDPARMASKSSNTPFFDWELPGSVVATVVGGGR
ncbi:dihydroorotase, partial [Candidatus Latescibacterota bacterium]